MFFFCFRQRIQLWILKKLLSNKIMIFFYFKEKSNFHADNQLKLSSLIMMSIIMINRAENHLKKLYVLNLLRYYKFRAHCSPRWDSLLSSRSKISTSTCYEHNLVTHLVIDIYYLEYCLESVRLHWFVPIMPTTSITFFREKSFFVTLYIYLFNT